MQNVKIRNALVGLVAILMIFLQTIVSAAEYSQWDCPECGRTGNTRKYCGECGHPAPELENDNKVTSISNDTSANEQPVIKDYLLAASQGDAETQHNLGYCYEQGIGVEQDYIKAYRWYKTANSNGYSSDGKELKTIKESYGDVISAKYPDDNGNFYETYYTYGTDSFEEDWRSLSSGYRSVTTYNTKEERLQVDSYTRDSSSQGWVYESTSRYSINEENQTEVESRYADGSKYIKILDDNEMPIFSQSYNADGSFKYASSYE